MAAGGASGAATTAVLAAGCGLEVVVMMRKWGGWSTGISWGGLCFWPRYLTVDGRGLGTGVRGLCIRVLSLVGDGLVRAGRASGAGGGCWDVWGRGGGAGRG